MKNNLKRFVVTIVIICLLIGITENSFAHSGRTDSNGGHKDNQNKSGLGSYHYHCGGYPAHLHDGGVCPYSTSAVTYSETSTQSSTSTSTTENKNTEIIQTQANVESKSVEETPVNEPTIKKSTNEEKTVKATIEKVESIKINENLTNMKVGETSKLTITIMPENATDKNIIWESSDEDIATISSTGKIVALEAGKVKITAKTNDGKTDMIEITVEKVEEIEEIVAPVQNNEITNTISTTSEDTDAGSAILGLGLIGGGIWAYKKFKKGRKES